jgi:hypothetical protein
MKLRLGIVLAVLFALAGCAEKQVPSTNGAASSARAKRTTPVCATQDCATGKMIDDGCAADGKCASCVNACPPK